MQNVQSYIQDQKEVLVSELIELLKIPSISTDSAFSQDVLNMAEAVYNSLKAAGCDVVEVCDTLGYPIVYAEKNIDPKLPTVLVYGHYDVQPADPIELWDHPPFDPIIKTTDIHPDGAIFSRGASDDKGQFYMHIKALEYMIKAGTLPCNVKFMIEGEEEVGSGHLNDFVKNNKEKLKNDIILISDTGMISNKQPSVTTGLRGICMVEVEVTGPNRDLHSGLYGGAVSNPINILAKMIGSMHDYQNRITIPGFYNDVLPLSEKERQEVNQVNLDDEKIKEDLSIEKLSGEEGFNTLERTTIRPSLDVNGIWGGYTGEGSKTIIPSKAYAKISIRLAPNQKHEEVSLMLKNYLQEIAPKSVKLNVISHHGGEAYLMPTDDIGYLAAEKAYEEAFNVKPIPQRSGGSIPVVKLFEEELGSKSVLMGFGLDSDAIHSPNEHFGIFNYLKGIETIPSFFKHFTKMVMESNRSL